MMIEMYGLEQMARQREAEVARRAEIVAKLQTAGLMSGPGIRERAADALLAVARHLDPAAARWQPCDDTVSTVRPAVS